MATSKDTLTYFLEVLRGVPELHAKAMFGEYGIYSGDRMFALACGNMLFFKTFPKTIHIFEDTVTKAYHGSKNTAPANPEWFEDREKMMEAVRLTLELVPHPKRKRNKS